MHDSYLSIDIKCHEHKNTSAQERFAFVTMNENPMFLKTNKTKCHENTVSVAVVRCCMSDSESHCFPVEDAWRRY